MKVGDISINGRVAYVRGKYYITELTRPIDDEILYRVFINDGYWRNQKISKFASVTLSRCIDWIARRRCFNR
jgi:hypothetical protein